MVASRFTSEERMKILGVMFLKCISEENEENQRLERFKFF